MHIKTAIIFILVSAYTQDMHFLFWHAIFGRESFFSHTVGCGASKASVGTLTRMSRSRPSSVARAPSTQIRRAGSFVKGLRSASLNHVGACKTSQFEVMFQ